MQTEPSRTSTDLTFVTNEPGNNLRDRFTTLLTNDTRHFDCLVGYFYISGFHKIYPALENVEKVRILVGLQTDRTAYELWQHARRDGELNLSHKSTKEKVSGDVLDELEKAPDAQAIETGVHKFVEWLRSDKLEIKAHPSENLHAKVYIMTFSESDRDKGRVITGSSNLTQSGLLDNLEFNVELKTRADYEFALTQGVKANVLFFDRKTAAKKPWTSKLWIYDLPPSRNYGATGPTNKHFNVQGEVILPSKEAISSEIAERFFSPQLCGVTKSNL